MKPIKCLCLLGLALVVVDLSGAAMLSETSRLTVRAFTFSGNRAFTAAQLAPVTAPFTGREITSGELEDARRAVTRFYVDRGYVNSGAVIPDQPADSGVVHIRIVEGELSAIAVRGNRWLRESYYRGRLQDAGGPPLHLPSLRDRLQLLRDHALVRQVNAELQPGARPGDSVLLATVEEELPFDLGLQGDNHRPPSVGAHQLLVLASHRSLTGNGDPLVLEYGVVDGSRDEWDWSGLDNLAGSYAIPFTPRETTLSLFGNKRDYAIIEEPFQNLNIDSESYSYGAALRHPLYRTPQDEVAVGLMFERRHSESELLGQPFNFAPGAVHGEMDISALRLFQEWIHRQQDHVLALRSTFSLGLDAFGVTDDGSDRDAKFWAWSGQAQYIQRLLGTANQLVCRVTAQLTTDPLLSLEQFSLGGATTVRGYRENALLRDQGVVGSVELRIPVWTNRAGNPIVQLAPFVDVGGGWNNDAPTPNEDTIASVGIGLLVTPHPNIHAEVYWGYALRDLDAPNNDPQDAGFHFRVTAYAF